MSKKFLEDASKLFDSPGAEADPQPQRGDAAATARPKRPSTPAAVAALEGKAATGSAKIVEKMAALQEENEKLKQQGSGVKIAMPVTRQEVSFTLQTIKTSLIDVSPKNERIQKFLDKVSLSDILPSFREHGQQKPGVIRPKGDGRFELIEGSRRLACAKLLDQDYLAFVGEVPDADVGDLSIIENRHKDVSVYEKAKSYQARIDAGEFESWRDLGRRYNVSDGDRDRLAKTARLDEIFVQILASPSDMPVTYAETIEALKKKDEAGLMAKAEELLDERKEALESGSNPKGPDEILKSLKSAVRVARPPQPTVRKPINYANPGSGVKLKQSVARKDNATKLEISGASEEQISEVMELVIKKLKLKKDEEGKGAK